jgi:acetyl esterase/lipase
MKRIALFILLIAFISVQAQQNQIIKIWDSVPEYSKPNQDHERKEYDELGVYRIYDVTIPILEYFIPQNPNGSAVVICPGGGYLRLAYQFEGEAVAKWFADKGISAFILKYRLPNDELMTNKEIVPLSDAQKSIKYLRDNADKYGIKKDKIGIIGFSAGGHLAASASTLFMKEVIPNNDKTNLRPDFSILGYPVISMNEEITHIGSRNNLIGEKPSEEMIHHFSNELNVTSDTPPTFLFHATDDKTVAVENSIRYYRSCLLNGVPVAMHIFEKGGHGFAMKKQVLDEQWLLLLEKWLVGREIIN